MNKPSGKPTTTNRIPVTLKTYNTVTFLKDRLHENTTYDEMIRVLIDCYTKRRGITIPNNGKGANNNG